VRNLPSLSETIRAHGIRAKKNMGQHFLLDSNLCNRIAQVAGELAKGSTIEIGAGPGGLTRALLDAGAFSLFAIEKDPRCKPALLELANAYPGRVTLIEGDALKTDLTILGNQPKRIVANLPYNIATELLFRWLPCIDTFESLVLMLQKEVVKRLAAKPGSKSYGRMTVMIQWLCTVEPMFDVNPTAFHPPPKVKSTVVRLIPREQPLAPAERLILERVTAAAFGQRRKMLRSSLRIFGDVSTLCADARIEPTDRAESLSVEDFCTLARSVAGRNTAALS